MCFQLYMIGEFRMQTASPLVIMASVALTVPVVAAPEAVEGDSSTQPSDKKLVTSRMVPSDPASASQGPASQPMSLWDEFNQGRKLGSDGDTTSTLLKMLAYVAVILVIGAAAIWITKRVLPRLTAAGGRGRDLAVVETTHLGPRKTLHVVEVGSRRFLLGSTRERISMLAEVTPPFPRVLESESAKESEANGPAEPTA